jgi:phosphatidylserine/phosphatidylglycerophosphate/cardiolipin synthase-like enzyme
MQKIYISIIELNLQKKDMSTFIHGTELNLALEDLIQNANDFIWFISPYIKLHERIKHELKRRKEDDQLQIIVVFGKNEDDYSKSISEEDINFLKEFPNVLICYEKNLHAKYYASDNFALITSMNLHQFSQNTNIEAGVLFPSKSTLNKLAGIITDTDGAGEHAFKYFGGIIEHSEHLYRKTPEYKSKFLGLTETFNGSIVEKNELAKFFSSKSNYKSSKPNSFNQYQKQNQPTQGYCIRTGVAIPYNPARPFSLDAYQSWIQFNNPDYSEKYCHLTGKHSYGKTSMRNPIM